MSSIKWEFPHPLLGADRDDYSYGSFNILEGSHHATADDFIFSFSYNLDCPGLEKYIENGNADVILNASSSAAKFRKEFHFSLGSHSLEAPIPKNDIVKNVEFTAYIVAHGDDSFCLTEHNKDYYNGASFSLRKGDILAISSTITIQIDDSQLQKPIASIFEIREYAGEKDVRAQAVFSEEKIIVLLSPESYRKYDLLKRRHPSIRRSLSAVVTMPALVNAIELMRCEGAAQYEGLRWYNSISMKLTKKGIDINSEDADGFTSTELANIIYEDIVFDALNAIQTVLDRAIDPIFQELGGMD